MALTPQHAAISNLHDLIAEWRPLAEKAVASLANDARDTERWVATEEVVIPGSVLLRLLEAIHPTPTNGAEQTTVAGAVLLAKARAALIEIQAHIERGGANEELTAATVKCSAALRSLDAPKSGDVREMLKVALEKAKNHGIRIGRELPNTEGDHISPLIDTFLASLAHIPVDQGPARELVRRAIEACAAHVRTREHITSPLGTFGVVRGLADHLLAVADNDAEIERILVGGGR